MQLHMKCYMKNNLFEIYFLFFQLDNAYNPSNCLKNKLELKVLSHCKDEIDSTIVEFRWLNPHKESFESIGKDFGLSKQAISYRENKLRERILNDSTRN